MRKEQGAAICGTLFFSESRKSKKARHIANRDIPSRAGKTG